jgi:hypothetical protein
MVKKLSLRQQKRFCWRKDVFISNTFVSYLNSALEPTTLHLFLSTRWTSQTRLHLD